MDLFFDVGLNVGDQFGVEDFEGSVVEDNNIFINGVFRKRIIIDSGADSEDYYYYMVEGVGISSDKWLLGILGISDENEYSCMISCSENGEIIFTNKDFRIPSNTNIVSSIEGDKHTRNVRYYNLAGVESTEPFHGVNLKVTTYSDGTHRTDKTVK